MRQSGQRGDGTWRHGCRHSPQNLRVQGRIEILKNNSLGCSLSLLCWVSFRAWERLEERTARASTPPLRSARAVSRVYGVSAGDVRGRRRNSANRPPEVNSSGVVAQHARQRAVRPARGAGMCDASEGGCEGPQPRRAPRRSGCHLKCVKCKEGSPALIIRTADAFCKSCFKDYFVHKFRATLGKNRCVYPGEKVLLAFSGGPSSSSMVRQVQDGLSQEAAKKLRFIPGIVYIDEGAVCGQSLEKRTEVSSQMEAVLQATGFSYHLVQLEEVFDLPSSILHSVSHSILNGGHSYKEAVDSFIRQQQHERMADAGNSVSDQLGKLGIQDSSQKQGRAHHAASSASSCTKKLTGLFDVVKTLTAKEDLLQTLRNHLLLHVARMHGYTKVMLGDSCTRVAVKLLTNLCLGRGAFLAVDTGFVDNRYGDVLFLRPMREYPAKEIAFYNRLFGVPTVFTPALDTKASDRASIHRLIESFLCKLQSDFPSTISTVYRTGEKLCPAAGHLDANESAQLASCLFCLCPLDTDLVGSSSLESVAVSGQPTHKLPPLSTENGCCGGAWKDAGSCKGPLEPQASSCHRQLSPLLCHSCRLTLKDMSCSDPLPTYIHLEAERRRCRAAMREEIQEFLLDEDSDTDEHLSLS